MLSTGHLKHRLVWSATGLCALIAGGCASTPPESPPEAVSAEQAEAPATKPDLPGVELSADLLYDVLLGEIARQRGELDVSLEALTRAARRTRDPRIVQHAARTALRAERFEDALAMGRLWVEIRPDELGARQALARALLELDRQAEAFEQFRIMLVGAGDEAGPVYRRISELLGREREGPGVLSLFDELIALHPDSAQAYYAKAYLADRKGDSAVTLQALDETLRLRPDWEEAALAKLAHLASRERNEELEAFVRRFLRKTPDANRVRLQYARYLVDQDRAEEALKQFVRAAEAEPQNADALLAAGLLSIEVEQYRPAMDYLRRNLALRPDSDRTRLYLGQVATELGQYDGAEQWYREITQQPYVFEAQLLIGAVIAARGDVDDAVVHLTSLQAGSDEEAVAVYLAQERIFRDAKRLEDAKSVLDQGLSVVPDDPELLYARGLVAAQLNLVELHESDLRKLIAKQPDNAHAYNALGYTLADQTNRYAEALDLIEKALALKPDDPFIMDSMGWVHYRLGNHEVALDFLERALDTREDAEIAAHLGEVLWVTGDRRRAETIWKRALERSPDNEVLLGTIRKLKQ